MSSILIELTANIVSSHAGTANMTSDELLIEIQKVYAALKQLEQSGETEDQSLAAADSAPALLPKKSIQKNQIICMVCGLGGFKTLTRHLNHAHGMKPGAYRKQFGLPAGTPLAAKGYSEARREAALKNKLGENLVKGREARKKNLAVKNEAPVKAAVAPKKPAAKTPASKKVVKNDKG